MNVPLLTWSVLPVRFPSWSNTFTAAISRSPIMMVAFTGSSMTGPFPLSRIRLSNVRTLKPVLQFRATAEIRALFAVASVSFLPAAVRNSDA